MISFSTFSHSVEISISNLYYNSKKYKYIIKKKLFKIKKNIRNNIRKNADNPIAAHSQKVADDQ